MGPAGRESWVFARVWGRFRVRRLSLGEGEPADRKEAGVVGGESSRRQSLGIARIESSAEYSDTLVQQFCCEVGKEVGRSVAEVEEDEGFSFVHESKKGGSQLLFLQAGNVSLPGR